MLRAKILVPFVLLATLLLLVKLTHAQHGDARKQLQFIPLEKVISLEVPRNVSTLEAERIAQSWVAAMPAQDPNLAAALVELLKDAPDAVVEEIANRVTKDNMLARALDAPGAASAQDRVRHSQVINLHKLRDVIPLDYDKQLRSAVRSTTGASENVVALMAYAPSFRSLPRSVVEEMLRAMEKTDLSDDARRELVSVLATHQQDLRPFASQLKTWRESTASDAAAIQRRNLALSVLIELNEDTAEPVFSSALESQDLAAMRTAVRALNRDGAPWSPKLAILVANQFRNAGSLEDWTAAYNALARRDPNGLVLEYEKVRVADIANAWRPEIAAEWVARAPPSATKQVASLPLDMKFANATDTDACAKLQFQLAVLGAQATAGKPTLSEFWNRITSRQHKCDKNIGNSIDAYLAKAGKVESSEAILGGYAKKGLGQLVGWHHGSAALSGTLMAAAATSIISGGPASARDFILAFVAPKPGALAQASYWQKPLPTDAAVLGWHFRVLQADRSAPDGAYKAAADFTTSTSPQAVARAQALLAIASGGRLARYQSVFEDALMSDDKTVAEVAAKLWANEILSGALDANALKEPSGQLLTDYLTRQDVSQETRTLFLSSLAKLRPGVAAFFSSSAKWVERPSGNCFVLAAVRNPPLSVAREILTAAESQSGSADELRACVALLYDSSAPVALLARNWATLQASDRSKALSALRTLWETPEFTEASSKLKKQIGGVVASAASTEPYSPAAKSSLEWWSDALKIANLPQATQVRTEYQKRWIALLVMAVPLAVALHLALWGVLLFFYPKSKRLQAIVFWNPLVRKALGLGYMDAVMLYVPFARKRLFSPFKASFLNDLVTESAQALDTKAYFTESLVRHKAAGVGIAVRTDTNAIPIVHALKNHRGRVLLQGKSGLGKSSFLRNWLLQRARVGDETIVYLRADQCKKGVEPVIQGRMHDLGSDQKLLRSVIYSGRIFVYIDGYNEVDLSTQEEITSFLASYPDGNILVTSQIPLRGLSSIETFELLPLDRSQIAQFLLSRDEVLSADAPVRGEKFREVSRAFLDDTWARPSSEDEAKAMEEILANPMDLTSVALLLSRGGVPDLFALEQQQFDSVVQRMAAQSVFRTLGFSKVLLEQRLKDQEDLSLLPFKPEVAELIYAKLANVRTFTDSSGKASVQEVRFRHDRIRDFFTHFALLALPAAEQAAYATDTRLSGVFPYLAKSMPIQAAEDLRERLLSIAAEVEDHRVADSFVKEYSWRQRLSATDPDWMLSFDLAAAKEADMHLSEVHHRRAELASRALAYQQQISRCRQFTRLLTETDPVAIVRLAKDTLVALGAVESPTPAAVGPVLSTPGGKGFVLVALAQAEGVRNFHFELLLARLQGIQGNVLAVVNWEANQPPDMRSPPAWQSELERCRSRLAVVTSYTLYEAYRAQVDESRDAKIWEQLVPRWAHAERQADVTEEAS